MLLSWKWFWEAAEEGPRFAAAAANLKGEKAAAGKRGLLAGANEGEAAYGARKGNEGKKRCSSLDESWNVRFLPPMERDSCW
jgi:hypothetical protein